MEILVTILFSVFSLLAAIHFSWALGGVGGFEDSIPKTEDGKWVIKPKKTDSAIVGTGLLLFGIFYLIKGDMISLQLSGWTMIIATWLIPSIFLLRSIGDFKYIGFFKKVKSTEFAAKDSKYYSPLCLGIATIGFALGFI
jgi:hypothetical protein